MKEGGVGEATHVHPLLVHLACRSAPHTTPLGHPTRVTQPGATHDERRRTSRAPGVAWGRVPTLQPRVEHGLRTWRCGTGGRGLDTVASKCCRQQTTDGTHKNESQQTK